MKRLLLSVSILAAIAGCSRASSTPAGVVEDFMRKMESGNCSGIANSLSASSKSVAGPKLEQACSAAGEMRKADPSKAKTVSSVNVLEAKETGDRATVRLEAVYSDGTKSGGEPIVVVRENGAWKIDLMATGMGSGGGGGMGGGPTPTPPMAPPATMPTAPTAPDMTPAPSATPAPAEAPDAADTPEPADAEK